MSRWIHVSTVLGTIALGIVSTLGCSMGAHPHDCKYAAYGGLIDRVDRVHGRVGSVLDPADVVVPTELNADGEATRPEPTPAAGQPQESDELLDSAEPREAQRRQDQESMHAEQDSSTPELIETHDKALYR